MSKSKVVHHGCPSTSLNNGLECWNLLRTTMENKTVRPWLYRPFPSSKNSHIQNETKCKTFVVKMSFICMRITETSFHINGFNLALKHET